MSKTDKRLPEPNHRPKSTAKRSVPGRGTTGSMTITATAAQNEFGRVLDQAMHDNVVVITRHNVPRAVVVSVERYRELASAESTILDTLTDEFDAMLARMQTPAISAGTMRGFHASPRQMGRAALDSVRRKR